MLKTTATPTKEGALSLAQRFANERKEPYAVYEHVGLYGHPTGDIPARHSFKFVPASKPEPGNDWAMFALVEPSLESQS